MAENWRIHARCADQTERFYPETPQDKIIAKTLCKLCPVRKLCLAEALATQEPFGIWGGQDEKERRSMVAIISAASLRVDLTHAAPALAPSGTDTNFRFVISL